MNHLPTLAQLDHLMKTLRDAGVIARANEETIRRVLARHLRIAYANGLTAANEDAPTNPRMIIPSLD